MNPSGNARRWRIDDREAMNRFLNLDRCYLIAEIGVNHNSDMDLAKKMILAAKESGADAVKFQAFAADRLVVPGTPKVKYQENTTSPDESHYEMIRSLELGMDGQRLLMEFCRGCEIDFISTPYDIRSAEALKDLGVEMFKIASADIVDLPLHEYVASTKIPAMLSTGMASLGEVEEALNVYRSHSHDDLVLLHCVSNYPCSDESLNLNVMRTLREAFRFPVGYSDHSEGREAAVLSIAFGAKVIEKHFTLDKSLPGPDHKASSTPQEFRELAFAVRRAETMLGDPVKRIQPEELQMSQVSRKSVVLAKPVEAGEAITRDVLTMKRPGTGLPAREIPRLLGKRARKAMPKDTLLSHLDVE